MNEHTKHPGEPNTPDGVPPPADDLDRLLRTWHAVNAERAAAGRDRLMARIRAQEHEPAPTAPAPEPLADRAAAPVINFLALLRSIVVNRYSPIAASLIAIVVIAVFFLPTRQSVAVARDDVAMVPDGGRLDALDDEGNVMGPCALEHTDVDVEISGFLTRVTLVQTYTNPYEDKIEAVYTFPLSHRAAVDRMIMTVGDRVVVGEVKEREAARRIYEAAKAQNYVASLLEQERPNIFTQSVANIEPGAEVVVEIAYVEVLQSKDGTYSFDFPMVVGPRYIPGAPIVSPSLVPAELTVRHGVNLLGPAALTAGAAGNVKDLGTLQPGKLQALLAAARPIKYPGDAWWGAGGATGGAGQAELWYRFEAEYADGAVEHGELYTDGTGHVNGRWFYTDPKTIEGLGTGYSQDTSQVPDASRITPMPARPGTRAGHDIGVTVTIDSGGPGIVDIDCPLHKVDTRALDKREDGTPTRVAITLADRSEIPNRDFVLSWKQTAEAIQEATFVHNGKAPDGKGGFFTLILQPPDRVTDAQVPPRELVFVMDVSGSMRGFPIEKSKAVMTRAIASMRPTDTFNVITFAGRTAVLWSGPQPATEANIAAATRFVESQQGGGGTEMMRAIEAALVQGPAHGPRVLTPEELANLPADGRAVEVEAAYRQILQTLQADPRLRSYTLRVRGDLMFPLQLPDGLPEVDDPATAKLRFGGRWETIEGRRVLVAHKAWVPAHGGAAGPMRIVVFLTDGYVGNDMAIIDAIEKNRKTTSVFSFGIGNSVNRYLIDGMARAGRGESEFVLLASDADAAVARLTKRIETPVLTNIELAFSENLAIDELIPAPGAIPDLFDAEPLVIHGRYAAPGTGTLTITGRTGAGAYERTVELDLPAEAPDHDVIATLWARSKVDQVITPHLKEVQQGNPPQQMRDEVVALGEQFEIMTQYTSFVAVEKSRITVGGKPVLVAVPIEMPDGVSYEGVFGAEGVAAEPIVLGQEFKATATTMVAGLPARAESEHRVTDGAVEGRERASVVARRKRMGPPGPPDRNLVNAPAEPQPASVPTGAVRGLTGDAGAKDEAGAGDGGETVELRRLLQQVGETRRSEEDLAAGRGRRGDDRMAVLADVVQGGEAFRNGRANEARVPLLAERVALGVGLLTADDMLEEARELADLLVEAMPGYATGVAMRDVLADETLDDDARKARIAALAGQAKAQIDAAIAQARRAATLRRVLEPALLALRAPGADGDQAGKATLTVTCLVERTDEPARTALTEAGLAIEDFSTTIPIVVGTCGAEDLEALALVEGVRRIERTRMSTAP